MSTVVLADSTTEKVPTKIIRSVSQTHLSESEESTSSESLPDTEFEEVNPIIPKPKKPIFSIPENYVPKNINNLSSDVELSVLGKIANILDNCILVRSNPSATVLDSGSVIFLESGTYLGEVYETFGPVCSPFYVIIPSNIFCPRNNSNVKIETLDDQIELNTSANQISNSETLSLSSNDISIKTVSNQNTNELENGADIKCEQIEISAYDNNHSDKNQIFQMGILKEYLKDYLTELGITIDCKVYFVPNNPDYTIPVFYDQLTQPKGSDASWINDCEPPPEALDFSDDEEEKLHKRNLIMKRKTPFEKQSSEVNIPKSKDNLSSSSSSLVPPKSNTHPTKFKQRASNRTSQSNFSYSDSYNTNFHNCPNRNAYSHESETYNWNAYDMNNYSYNSFYNNYNPKPPQQNISTTSNHWHQSYYNSQYYPNNFSPTQSFTSYSTCQQFPTTLQPPPPPPPQPLHLAAFPQVSMASSQPSYHYAPISYESYSWMMRNPPPG